MIRAQIAADDLISHLTITERFEALALIAASLPMDIIDLKDIVDICKENKDAYEAREIQPLPEDLLPYCSTCGPSSCVCGIQNFSL